MNEELDFKFIGDKTLVDLADKNFSDRDLDKQSGAKPSYHDLKKPGELTETGKVMNEEITSRMRAAAVALNKNSVRTR